MSVKVEKLTEAKGRLETAQEGLRSSVQVLQHLVNDFEPEYIALWIDKYARDIIYYSDKVRHNKELISILEDINKEEDYGKN